VPWIGSLDGGVPGCSLREMLGETLEGRLEGERLGSLEGRVPGSLVREVPLSRARGLNPLSWREGEGLIRVLASLRPLLPHLPHAYLS